MSTDSRYSPWRSAIAVPPPNRHAFAASRSASSARRSASTRRWCGRSNKEPPSSDVLHQRVDERALGVIERRRVHLAPVALVEAEGVLARQRFHAVQLPGQALELWIVGDTNPRGKRRLAARPALDAAALARVDK